MKSTLACFKVMRGRGGANLRTIAAENASESDSSARLGRGRARPHLRTRPHISVRIAQGFQQPAHAVHMRRSFRCVWLAVDVVLRNCYTSQVCGVALHPCSHDGAKNATCSDAYIRRARTKDVSVRIEAVRLSLHAVPAVCKAQSQAAFAS